MPSNSHGHCSGAAPSDDASGKKRRPASQRSDESRKENKESKENSDGMVAAPWNLNIDIKDCCLDKVFPPWSLQNRCVVSEKILHTISLNCWFSLIWVRKKVTFTFNKIDSHSGPTQQPKMIKWASRNPAQIRNPGEQWPKPWLYCCNDGNKLPSYVGIILSATIRNPSWTNQ